MQSLNDVGDYFESYEDLEIHKLMLEDSVRVRAFKKAIMDNSYYIKNSTVLDVGAGTGILSVFCAQAGASKVFAVEASNTYKLAKAIVKENKFEDVIQVIHDEVENVSLPNGMKVDIIVSEWMGFYLFHEGMLESVLFARDNFLKEDGLMFPEIATLYVVPCSVPSLYDQWHNVEGTSMQAFSKCLRQKAQSKPQTIIIKSDDVVASAEAIFWSDLKSLTAESLEELVLQHVFVANKDGKVQGLALWFTCTFPTHTEEPVILSTDPDDAPTHWKQTVIVLPEEQSVEQGEPIALRVSLRKATDNSRRYNIELQMLDPDLVDHPEYCGCDMTKCILAKAVIDKYSSQPNN